MLNVRANVKVLEFKSFCIFSCILSLLIILKNSLTTKAYDRRASGDCGTSGELSNSTFFLSMRMITNYVASEVYFIQLQMGYFIFVILGHLCIRSYMSVIHVSQG